MDLGAQAMESQLSPAWPAKRVLPEFSARWAQKAWQLTMALASWRCEEVKPQGVVKRSAVALQQLQTFPAQA